MLGFKPCTLNTEKQLRSFCGFTAGDEILEQPGRMAAEGRVSSGIDVVVGTVGIHLEGIVGIELEESVGQVDLSLETGSLSFGPQPPGVPFSEG